LFSRLKKIFFKPTKLPGHIAVIMDGNGRWAKKRFLPRIAGHSKGTEAAEKIVKYCFKYHIKTLTLFTFSTENWQRPDEEVDGLLNLFEESIVKSRASLIKNNIAIRFIGDKKLFSEELQCKLQELEKTCSKNNGLDLNIALNYGGRSEIVRATNSFYQKEGKLITESDLTNHLDTAGMPEVDLLIRTGGEKRISNFLLWQIAYAELFFTKVLWPDFSEEHFVEALQWFQKTNRTFGKLTDDLNA